MDATRQTGQGEPVTPRKRSAKPEVGPCLAVKAGHFKLAQDRTFELGLDMKQALLPPSKQQQACPWVLADSPVTRVVFFRMIYAKQSSRGSRGQRIGVASVHLRSVGIKHLVMQRQVAGGLHYPKYELARPISPL